MRKTGKIAFVTLTFALVATFGLIGCSQQAEPENEGKADAEEVETPATEELRVIGNDTDTAYKIEVENATGKEITGLSVKLSSEESYPSSLVKSSDPIEANEAFILCVEPVAAGSNAAGTPEGEAPSGEADRAADIALRDLYNVSIEFADNTKAELHDVSAEALQDVKDLKFHLSSDGIGYLEYTDSKGASESTLESEKALVAQAEAAAQAEAEAAAQAEAEAQAAAEAEAAAAADAEQYDYGYDEGYGDTSGGGGYDYSYDDSGSSGGGQSEDQCADDVMLR